MADCAQAPGRAFAQSLALWAAVMGLIVGSATLLVATQLLAAPGDGPVSALHIGALLAAFPGPFLLALASLRLGSPARQRVVWLIAGLLALIAGSATIFSGAGVFLVAASIGLIAAWWFSR